MRRNAICATRDIGGDPVCNARRGQRVAAGGRRSYGTRLADADRLLGICADRSLKRVKPADLPARADEVIE
jgi:hypothetical protein